MAEKKRPAKYGDPGFVGPPKLPSRATTTALKLQARQRMPRSKPKAKPAASKPPAKTIFGAARLLQKAAKR